MGKTKIIELTKEKGQELENGYRNGQSHAFPHSLSDDFIEKRAADFFRNQQTGRQL